MTICKEPLLLVLVLTLITPPASNAQSGADGLAGAARMAAHAQAVEDQCQYHESAEWLGRAVTVLQRYHTADAGQAHAAGSMLAQLEIRICGVKKRPAELDREQQKVTTLLAASRTESADRELRSLLAPACEVRFARLESLVAQRQAEARELIRQGIAATARSDKKAALITFQGAAAADAESPGLAEAWQSARALSTNHKALKAFAAILVVGALGGGGYYAYEKYGKKAGPPSNPQSVSSPR